MATIVIEIYHGTFQHLVEFVTQEFINQKW